MPSAGASRSLKDRLSTTTSCPPPASSRATWEPISPPPTTRCLSQAQSSLVPAMSAAQILHVVPHPGGGGETYIRYLESMGDVRFESLPLTEYGSPHETPAGLVRLARAMGGYDVVHIHGDSSALVSLPVIGRRPTVITLNGVHLARRTRGVRGRAVRAGLRRAFERSDGVIAVSEAEPPSRARWRPGPPTGSSSSTTACPSATSRPMPIGRRPRGPRDRARRGGGDVRRRAHRPEAAAAVRGGGQCGAGRAPGDRRPRARRGAAAAPARSRCSRTGSACSVTELTSPSCWARPTSSFPSLWEGMAYAVLEPMALGRALLVSDGPGNPDAVGDAGLVFPAGDVPGMAAALGRLAADHLRASLGEAARRRARERFSVAGMARATKAVYERALGRRRAREDRDRLRLPLPEHRGRGRALVPQPRRAARRRA